MISNFKIFLNNIYEQRCKIARINKRIKPKTVAFLPRKEEAYLPIHNPSKVNEKLTIANIIIANIWLVVIAFNPKPVEKASIETPKENKKIPKKDKSNETFSSFFKSSYNRLKAKKSKIQPRKI